MIIESIELKNYRNYKELHMEFNQGTNILYGDNAQGKTNILEAIYVCCTSKSHKNAKDRDMIRFRQDESHIKLQIRKNRVPYRLDMHLKKNKAKGIAINRIPIRKASELFGIANVIFFSPEDLNIIKNGPSERRRFIDMELCQLNKLYVHSLVQYNKALLQRNKLLKQIAYKPSLIDTLDIWDEQLVLYGTKIIKSRTKFLEMLSEIVTENNIKLTGGREHVKVFYEPDILDFSRKLKENREKDMHFCNTGVGPHRDDICFINDDIDIRRYGSQGQQRTCALSLKLAEIELVKKIIGDTPVLLLDDVLSELDRNRQNFLLESISDIQTIVTCTGLEEFIDKSLALDRIFKVTNGTVQIEK